MQRLHKLANLGAFGIFIDIEASDQVPRIRDNKAIIS